MPIYLIESKTWEAMRGLDFEQDGGIVFKKRYRRAVVFCREELTFPRGFRVFDVQQEDEPGQVFKSACKSWLSSLTIIDDLSAAYQVLVEKTEPVDLRRLGQKAEAEWMKARQALEEAEDGLLAAEDALREATAQFVRTHGKGPYGVGNAVWYVCCAYEPYPHVWLMDLGKQWKRKLTIDKRRSVRRRRHR
jgi:hypothetical protein